MTIQKKDTINGLLFISPWIVGFALFMGYPLLSALFYSMTEYNVIQTPEWVGLDNFRRLIFRDRLFLKSLYNTLYMVFIGLSVVTVVTIAVSILLDDSRVRGLSFYRVVFFLPTLVPLVILAILWIWILQPESGVVNSLLRVFGIEGPGWFASPRWAKPAFILMMLWGSGNMIIIYLAGLKDISPSLYEAASIDGATYLQKIFRITIPLLRPVILFNVITGIIRILQSFAESFIITSGGPDGATLFYGLYLYQNAFQYFRMGYASAMAWILLLVAMGFVALLFRYASEWNSGAE